MKNLAIRQEAKSLLTSYLEAKEVSKVKLAKKIGISHAVLTYVTQEQWENVSDEMLYKIINSLKISNEVYKIVKTANYNTVFNLCEKAQKWHHMYGLIGCAGSGKTTSLKRFYTANRYVFYVECKHTMNRKQFFAAILKELGINYAGTVYDMVTRIEEEFNTLENPLLIIDEAGKLSHNLILDLHDLRNSTMNNLGIVLAGCEYFKDNLEKGVQKDKQGIPEFYGRVVQWQILNTPTRKEVEAICSINNVDMESMTKRVYPNFREVYNDVSSQFILSGFTHNFTESNPSLRVID
jgi:DNA transposition AAA+ family ATPase